MSRCDTLDQCFGSSILAEYLSGGDPDPGFDDQKLKNNLQLKIFFIFFIY